MKPFIFLCSFLFASSLFADPIREIKDFKIIYSKDNKLVVHTIDFAKLSQKNSLSIISPHPRMNPQKLKEEWSGVNLSELFKTYKVPYADTSKISVVATDYYSAEITGANVRNLAILLATQKNKKKIDYFEGGPQLVYPLNNRKIPEEFKNDAWWVWYVGAIYVGDVQPIVNWKAKGQEPKQVRLWEASAQVVAPDKPKFTQGKRITPDPQHVSTTTAITLETFCKDQKSPCAHSLKVTDSLGKSLKMTKEQFQSRLIFKWNKDNIPTGFGGPVQFCTPSGECLFHILEVSEED